jgi:hypothetical protein
MRMALNIGADAVDAIAVAIEQEPGDYGWSVGITGGIACGILYLSITGK